jgi:hypothetical protein
MVTENKKVYITAVNFDEVQGGKCKGVLRAGTDKFLTQKCPERRGKDAL